jgi:hypothetical protein
MGAHNNKKSIKPEKETVKKNDTVETNKDKIEEFLEVLVNEGLDTNLPPGASKWAEEHFDKKWLEDFKNDLKTLSDEILTSHYFPSEPTMILLKLAFLLRK